MIGFNVQIVNLLLVIKNKEEKIICFVKLTIYIDVLDKVILMVLGWKVEVFVIKIDKVVIII